MLSQELVSLETLFIQTHELCLKAGFHLFQLISPRTHNKGNGATAFKQWMAVAVRMAGFGEVQKTKPFWGCSPLEALAELNISLGGSGIVTKEKPFRRRRKMSRNGETAVVESYVADLRSRTGGSKIFKSEAELLEFQEKNPESTYDVGIRLEDGTRIAFQYDKPAEYPIGSKIVFRVCDCGEVLGWMPEDETVAVCHDCFTRSKDESVKNEGCVTAA